MNFDALILAAPLPVELPNGTTVRVLDERSTFYRCVGIVLRTYPQRNAHSPHRAVVALVSTDPNGMKRKTMRGFPLTALRRVST